MVKVISVIGRSKSGKTTTVEYIISNLSGQGYKVGSAKHVHHSNFTLDVEGKDTWRHAKSGSVRVACVSESEVVVIRKEKGGEYTFENLMKLFNDEKFDFIILEGFHQTVSTRKDTIKIITAEDEKDAERVLKGTSPPIIAVTGKISNTQQGAIQNTPIINIKTEGHKLISKIIKQN